MQSNIMLIYINSKKGLQIKSSNFNIFTYSQEFTKN